MKTAAPAALPGADAHAEALILEARRRQRRRYLRTGVAFVALACVAGVAVSQLGPGVQPPVRAVAGIRFPAGSARYSSAPAYYAYTVEGDLYRYVSHGTQYGASVPGRYLKLRATATGKLLATISPPKPYNDFSLLTADASGRTFVFGARRFWQRNAGPSPRLMERNQRTPLRFLLLHITPAGHLQRAWLSLPETLTPAQAPSIALSPDGTKLAVAFSGAGRTATVQTVTFATGRIRQWVLPHTAWTPVLSGQGAWTADGRMLAFQPAVIPAAGPMGGYRRLTRPYREPGTTQVRLLDTEAPGTSLAASNFLVLRPPAGESALGQPILTPDGTGLIGPVGNEPFEPGNRPWTGELAVYSASTGALLHTMAHWVWRWPSPPARGGNPMQAIAWSNRTGSQLIVLHPRHELNVLGVLRGNRFTQAGSKLLPRQPAGYGQLQYALRIAPRMTW